MLADPEGNEFCVIEPGNNFLADCGFIGPLACDGSQQVGYFCSQALGWPSPWRPRPGRCRLETPRVGHTSGSISGVPQIGSPWSGEMVAVPT